MICFYGEFNFKKLLFRDIYHLRVPQQLFGGKKKEFSILSALNVDYGQGEFI